VIGVSNMIFLPFICFDALGACPARR